MLALLETSNLFICDFVEPEKIICRKWYSSVPRKLKHRVFQGLNRNEWSSECQVALIRNYVPKELPLQDFEVLIEDHSVHIYTCTQKIIFAQYGTQGPAIMGFR